MSASVADDLIRSYFDRWQRLEEEKRTVSDDLKELFAEAKGNGLDTKALRTVFREQVGDRAAIEEFDAICDLYRASLSRPRAGRADAREKTLNNFVSPAVEPMQKTHEFDPETGEIIETQESAVSSDRNEPGRDASLNAPTGSASDEMPETVSPAHFLRAGDDGRPQTSTEAYQVKDAGQGGIIVGVYSEQEKAGGPQGGNEAASGLPAPAANPAPVIGHVSFATSSHINPDDMPEIPDFLKRDFQKELA